MSLSFFAAVEDIREAAMEYRLPGTRKKFLWSTILSQVAKSDMCDGALADTLLDIIRDYLDKTADDDLSSRRSQFQVGAWIIKHERHWHNLLTT